MTNMNAKHLVNYFLVVKDRILTNIKILLEELSEWELPKNIEDLILVETRLNDHGHNRPYW